jgi:hypothetical protein
MESELLIAQLAMLLEKRAAQDRLSDFDITSL